jgi:hypothetical protein
MAKTADQTQQAEEEAQDVAVETHEEDSALEAATKTSEEFDKLIDDAGVEDIPSEDTTSEKEPEEPEAEADETNTGDEEEPEANATDEKDATDTGEAAVGKELAQKALDLGLTEEEVKQFASDEELQKTVGIIESVIAAEGGEKEAQPAKEPAGEEPEKEEPESTLKFENEEDIDPELLQNIKAMDKRYRDEVAALKAELSGLTEGIQKEQAEQFVKRFDAMVDAQGLDFADTFGKGRTLELNKTSLAYKNRDAVRSRMHAFAKGMLDSGIEIPDEQQLFDLAMTSLFGKKIETVKGSRMKKKTTARSKQRIGRAATKKAGSLTPEQKAIETSRKFDELIDTSED